MRTTRFLLPTLLAATAVSWCVIGCAADTRYSQAQLDAIQSRDLDVSADRAYQAVIGALLEQRYEILESDMEGGLLVATTVTGDEWSGWRRTTVQVAVMRTGADGSTVRISTSTGGQTRVNEEQIAHLHARVDVHAHTPIAELVWEPAP